MKILDFFLSVLELFIKIQIFTECRTLDDKCSINIWSFEIMPLC